MEVVLKAVSHPGMGDIPLRDNLCLIGRQEAPFLASGVAEASKLSRRHARIFQQDGVTYAVDLDSTNGSSLNGRPVTDQPVPLKHGDELCFAAHFVYRIEMCDATRLANVDQAAQGVRVMLEKDYSDDRRDFIVLAHFPFLVSKADPSIARYKEAYPTLVEKVSRRHAYIFIKDQSVYIEDLNSTNGTYVSGTKLDEQPRVLVDGDTVAFGTADFLFRVHIEQETPYELEPTVQREPSISAAHVADASDGTIFVDSATSFLEIFCEKIAANKAVGDDSAAGQDNIADAARSPRSTGRAPTVLSFLGLAGKNPKAKRRRIVLGATLAAVALSIAAVWTFVGREHPVKSLLAQGRYLDSARAANQMLAADPDNTVIAAYATEAIIKEVVPQWLASLQGGDAAATEAILVSARSELASHSKEGQGVLDTLAWVGDIEAFFKSREGTVLPLALFKDEEPVQALVSQWERDRSEIARLSTIVAGMLPAYERVYADALSKLRRLRDAQSLYLQAMEGLKQRLKEHLKNGKLDAADGDLEAFRSKFPNISGVDDLKADLRDYALMSNLIQTKDLAGISHARQASEIRTPLFQEAFSDAFGSTLPSSEVMAEYDRSLALWKDGSFDQAVAILEPLVDKPWGEVARARIDRYGKVAAAYAELQRTRDSANYSSSLLGFYRDLDPADDTFFLRAIEPDVAKYRDRALASADDLARLAQEDWNAYLRNDGISARNRVEKNVSEHFKRQAQRLSNAFRLVEKAAGTYDLLRMEYPPDFSGLRDTVAGEIRRQRQWLTDLKLVIDPSLLAQKLQLLPEL